MNDCVLTGDLGKRFAFNGVPYTLYLFIGNPHQLAHDNLNHLHEHVQNVGFVFTFSNPILPHGNMRGCRSCQHKKTEGTKSRAQVPITGALLARLQEHGDQEPDLPTGIPPLPGWSSDHVQAYLEANLHWRVKSVSNHSPCSHSTISLFSCEHYAFPWAGDTSIIGGQFSRSRRKRDKSNINEHGLNSIPGKIFLFLMTIPLSRYRYTIVMRASTFPVPTDISAWRGLPILDVVVTDIVNKFKR